MLKCLVVPRDCLELFEQYGIRKSGPHYISPDNKAVVRAFCDMETDGGGWTVWFLKTYRCLKTIGVMAYLHNVKERLHAFIARLHGAWTHRIMLRHFYTV